jgi:hypothetical protein
VKLFLEAVQAVTVELLGVVLVVWSLFGFASWGLKSAAGSEPTWNRSVAGSVESWTSSFSRSAGLAPPSAEVRSEYVAQRLERYGQLLGTAAKNVWRASCRTQARSASEAPPA